MSRAASPRRPWAQGLLSAAVVVAVVWYSRSMVDWGQVWVAVVDMTWLELLTLALLAAWNILTYLFVMVAAMPGLSYRDAFVVGQSSTAVSATLPAGSALGVGLSYRMYASYGHDGRKIALATVLTGVWNNFVKLGLPVVALAVLTLQGRATGAETTAAMTGLTVLAAAIVVLVLVLRGDAFAARVGGVLEWAARGPARVLRRPIRTSWAQATVRFRHQTVDLLRRRWHLLTLATLVSHLSLYLVLLVALRHMDVGEAQVGWAQVLAVFAFMRLVTALPITPGGVGLVELGLVAGLVVAGGERPAVVAAVLVFRVLTLFLQIPIGLASYVVWRRRQAHAEPSAVASPAGGAAP